VNRLAVLGAGQVSACGRGVDALRKALRGALPAPTRARHPHAVPDASVPVFVADPTGIEEVIGPRKASRLDAFAKRFLLAAMLAKEDAGEDPIDPERIGAVVATGYGPLRTTFGFLDGIIDDGDDMGPPFLFSGSVHNAPAAAISAFLGFQGPTLTLTAFAHGWARALEVAAGWLGEGTVDRVVVGAGDEYHELVSRGLAARGGWPADGRIRPLDFDACSYVPGETFVALVLGRAEETRSRWGSVEPPRFFDGTASVPSLADAPVYLGAKGERAAGPAYRAVACKVRSVLGPASIWGANPTSDAMTSLAAGIALRDRVHPVFPEVDGAPAKIDALAAGSACDAPRIHCVSCDLPGEGVVVTWHAGGSASEESD